MMPRERLIMPRWTLLAALGVVSVALLAGGRHIYRREDQAIRESMCAELKAIAKLKIDKIVAWRHDRSADAHLIAGGPLLRTAILAWIARPNNDSLRAAVTGTLEAVRDYHGHAGVFLTDLDGGFHIHAGDFPAALDSHAAPLVDRAVSARNAVFGDLHLCGACADVPLGAAAPMLEATAGHEPPSSWGWTRSASSFHRFADAVRQWVLYWLILNEPPPPRGCDAPR
jgi:hypothetical protein